MDVLEIDAASNNGVDNVRDLRDDAIYSPSQVKMRVYIIDEVHMLSLSAFNALLKIIEEPPEHLLFILATTELHKVPATILSRCQRFSFRRISQEDIAARLQYVAYQENIDLDDSAARVLARMADGGMRDALSLLDQCASATTGELTDARVYACLGIAGIQECGKLLTCIANQDASGALSLLNRFYAEGKDMGALLDEMACVTRDIMVLRTAPKEGLTMLSGVATDAEVQNLSERFSDGELVRIMNMIHKTAAGFSKSAGRRLDMELLLVNLCQPSLCLDPEALNARLTRMEEQLRSGAFVARSEPQLADDDCPPMFTDDDVPPDPNQPPTYDAPPINEAPEGFWPELVSQLRKELRPPLSSFFTSTPTSPVRGFLQGDRLILLCTNNFAKGMVDKPEIVTLVSAKATALLGRKVGVVITDQQENLQKNEQMEQLLDFSRAHSDIIRIKND